jgi:hypothetical protein
MTESELMPFDWEAEALITLTEERSAQALEDLKRQEEYWARIDKIRGMA